MIYNHLDITVQVHDTLEGHHRIVGFEVEPYSMAEDQHRSSNHSKSSSGPMYLTGNNQEVTFSFNIITRPDPMTTWSMRMDHYVKFGDNNIHLAAILYALFTIAVGVLLLIYVLQRALGNDFKQLELISQDKRARRNERRNKESSEDEIGLTSNR
jgi:hypothetical protein